MKVSASQFHPMLGHMQDGATIIFGDGGELKLKGVMQGWVLVDAHGNWAFGPVSSASAITEKIVSLESGIKTRT